MRTTLTLEPDVEQLLKQAMHGEKAGMKETLNAALRRGLAHHSAGAPAKPFVIEAKPMGLRAGLDPARLHDLADELELEAFAATTRRGRRSPKVIIPDANLLLYAYDSDSPFHQSAARWWTKLLSGSEPVGLCPVVIFGFLRLATHAKVFERPLTANEATERIRSWIERPNVRLLYPGPRHFEAVCTLLKTAGTAGNLVTDAQIAALALEYGAAIHSADTDFARFKGLKWHNPLAR